MREILLAVQSALQDGISYIRNNDIYISYHDVFLPATCMRPCIGIKDGPVKRVEEISRFLEITYNVNVIVFVELLKDTSHHACVLGDSVKKGVLEICEDINNVLDENTLGIDGMIHAFCKDESASELLNNDRGFLLRKILTYQYIMEKQR